MVAATLVDELILDGANLLRELDRSGFPVEAMFWVVMPDQDYWRLVIGSPIVAELGPAAAYDRLNKVLRGMKMDLAGLTSADISVFDPQSQQFEALFSLTRSSGRLAAGKSWNRLENAVVYRWNNQFLTGKMSCEVSAEELTGFWDEERTMQNQNEPALLIDVNDRMVTLRFHPKHSPLTATNIQELKRPFQIALHRRMRDCDISWID